MSVFQQLPKKSSLGAPLIAVVIGVAASIHPPVAGAQDSVRVTIVDAGPGGSGRILQDALRRPHRLVEPDSTWFILRRGRSLSTTLIVLGRSAAIDANVDGDVVVVGGDLFVRPAAHISGRAVAIGGGVYPSALAIVAGGTESFRDNTFSITRTELGYQLAYVSLRVNPSPPVVFPALYGMRMPTYDRVDGVSLPYGPTLTFADGRGELTPLLVYRSDLGKIDPVVKGRLEITRRLHVDARIGRETFTNDDWIWSDFVNSLSTLAYGTDTRNYFRAERAELRARRMWEWPHLQLEPFVGARMERAWSVGPFVGETRAPWSLWGRRDSLHMRRPNPAITDGYIGSTLAGTTLQWDAGGVTISATSGAEIAFTAPGDRAFAQITSDLDGSFLTFGNQEYGINAHWITTPSGAPPAQRFAYVGGAGTLPFEDLLDEGGDEVLLIDQRYTYPLLNVQLGMVGSPTLLLRHRLASAGLHKLPAFGQVLGVGAMLAVLRVELQLDPATRRKRFSAGLTFSR